MLSSFIVKRGIDIMKVKEEIKKSNEVIEESNPATLEEVVEMAKVYEKSKGMSEEKEL